MPFNCAKACNACQVVETTVSSTSAPEALPPTTTDTAIQGIPFNAI